MIDAHAREHMLAHTHKHANTGEFGVSLVLSLGVTKKTHASGRACCRSADTYVQPMPLPVRLFRTVLSRLSLMRKMCIESCLLKHVSYRMSASAYSQTAASIHPSGSGMSLPCSSHSLGTTFHSFSSTHLHCKIDTACERSVADL